MFKRQLREKVKTYIVISDLHAPYHCKNAIDAICKFGADLRPDGVVINGDFLDFQELSRHNKASVKKLETKRVVDSFDVGNSLLDQLQASMGRQCKEWHYIEGNHDARPWRWANEGDNSVFHNDPLLDLTKRLQLSDRGIQWHGQYPQAHVKLGSLLVTHGIWCGEHYAKAHVDKFKCSVMLGHVHTSQTHYSSCHGAQVAGFGLGHLMDPESEAANYAATPNRWVQGFAVVYVRPNGEFNVHMINFWNGVFFYGNRRYGKPRK